MNKRFSEARAKGQLADARMLLYEVSLHAQELQNTCHLVVRVEGGPDLTKVIQATLVAFNYENIYRVYHKQVNGKQQKLRQYRLTMASQDRVHRAVTRRLSAKFTFDDVYLSLSLHDMEHQPAAR